MKNTVIFAFLMIPFSVFATNGYFPHGWGTKYKAMGGVSIASPQDSIAAANNPAGMSVVGNRFDVGFESFSPKRYGEIDGANTPGGPLNVELNGNGIKHFVIPELGFNHDMGRSTFGVAIFGNGGMNTSYDNGVPLFGTGPAGVNLSQLFISPTYTYQINDNHALGASLNLAYQEFEAKGIQNFDNPAFTASPGSVSNRGADSSTGAGATIGWFGRFDKLQLGAIYRTVTAMSAFEEYEGLFAEQGDFDIPSMYGIGMAYQVNPKFNVGLDVTRIMYSDVAAVSNPLSKLAENNPLGSDDGPGFGWEDITVLKLGGSYKHSDQFTFRMGVNHGENPVPDSETFFNILAPGVVETHFTLGGTYHSSDNMEVSFMYMHAFDTEVKGQNSIPPGFGGGEANVNMHQSAFAITLGWLYGK